ncbi:hypothetical protein ACEPPN_002774 [Leptodophora sp. 'Broadleaf-Isolate-01']
MEYGRECWCADEFGAGSLLVPNADCSMTCAGDPYAYCGAGNRLQVYQKAGTGSASTSSSRLVSSSASVTISVSVSASSAVKPVSTATSASSSASASKSSSSSSSFVSRSVSGSSSTSKPASTTSRAASSTSKPATLSTSTTSSAAPQGTQAIKPTIGAYSYYGCQTEGTDIRALTGGFFFNETAMTLEMCAANCAGFKYWGVEYGAECYCGNEFQVGSVAVPHTDCTFPCPGNALEFCGAGNRLSSYVLTV